MGGSGQKNKRGMFDVLAELQDGIDFSKLPPFTKYNLAMTIIIAVVTLALAIPPILSWVSEIIVNIGNIFISLYSTREILPSNTSVSWISTAICAIILATETVICLVFSYKATKLNATDSDVTKKTGPTE